MRKQLILLAILAAVALGAYFAVSGAGLFRGASGRNTILIETRHPEESANQDWWLLLGGYMRITEDSWSTIQGPLKKDDFWRMVYLRRNPLDTDNGYYPQNVFWLLSKDAYNNPTQEIEFLITVDRTTKSPNKNESSGIFLISNYSDMDNYYLAGLEIDGEAVIRKKYGGTYAYLAKSRAFGEEDEYSAETRASLLPQKTPIRLRSQIEYETESTVIKLFQQTESGWILLAQAIDNGEIHGASLKNGKVGLKSGFMDITITDYLLDNVSAVKQGAN